MRPPRASRAPETDPMNLAFSVRWVAEPISHNDGKWCWRVYVNGTAFYLIEPKTD